MKTIVWRLKWKGCGSGHGLLDILSKHLPGRIEEKTWKPSVKITGVQAKIWTTHLPNTSPESYHQANLLGVCHTNIIRISISILIQNYL
jgi:hypothetical protein